VARPAHPDFTSGQLSGRSLDPGSNAGARGMVATPGEPGGQNSAYRFARAFRPTWETGCKVLWERRRLARISDSGSAPLRLKTKSKSLPYAPRVLRLSSASTTFR